jgi:hypothetical protein
VIQELVRLEIKRAREQYPTPLSLHGGIGLLFAKLSRFVTFSAGHAVFTDEPSARVCRILLIQIAAVAIRLCEDVLGTTTVEDYNAYNENSDRVKGIKP